MARHITPRRIWFALWLALSGLLLALAYVERDIHDMPILLFWALMAINFPSSIASALVVALISPLLPINGFQAHVAVWAPFTLLGYLQWGVLLPWLWQRFSSPRSHMRIVVLTIVLVGSGFWGFNDMADGNGARFAARVLGALSIAAALLWWASRPPSGAQQGSE
jgi:hypothetical protein